ncbi:hypothetical protein [Phnomibacter sp. MR]|uniref:hypothetical protein n=1 Tax=Phnomibacter sp. MR TaxID=3042318 RepID=UPI003A8074E0
MTVEQLITLFVYQHGEISLQGIGHIRLLDAVPDAEYIQKNKSVPITGIEFKHVKTAATSPDFIRFYATQRGKIASLAENDIEAYLSMAVQFLNIGNPFEIKGLGALAKNKDGVLSLTPGYFLAIKAEEAMGKLKERHVEDPAHHGPGAAYDEEKRNRMSPQTKGILAIVLLVLLVVVGWWMYKAFVATPETASTESLSPVNTDTLVAQQVDSAATAQPAPALPDSLQPRNWKVIFRETSNVKKAIVLNQFDTLKQQLKTPVYLETTDSVRFTFYTLSSSAVKDTAQLRDSLRRYFKRPVRLLPAQ